MFLKGNVIINLLLMVIGLFNFNKVKNILLIINGNWTCNPKDPQETDISGNTNNVCEMTI